MTTTRDTSKACKRLVLVSLGAAGLTALAAGCTIPINTGLGARKKPMTVQESAAASKQAYEFGNPDQAKEILRNAEDTARSHPAEKPELADTLIDIATTQSRKGNHLEAQELHERALVIREEVYGPSNPEVAESLTFLGAEYYFNQRYAEAEQAFKRALVIRQQTAGPENRLTGLSMNNLAFFYAGVGRYDDADPLFRESIRIIVDAPDSLAAEKARALDNYQAMLLDAGRSEEAEKVKEDAAAYKTKRKLVEDILEKTK